MPNRLIQRKDRPRMRSHRNDGRALAREQVVQERLHPAGMLLQRLPNVRPPQTILLGKSRLGFKSGVVLTYPRPRPSAVARVDPEPLADEFLDDGREGRRRQRQARESQFARLEAAGERARVVAGREGQVQGRRGVGPEGFHG